jgi:hypothetical protein
VDPVQTLNHFFGHGFLHGSRRFRRFFFTSICPAGGQLFSFRRTFLADFVKLGLVFGLLRGGFGCGFGFGLALGVFLSLKAGRFIGLGLGLCLCFGLGFGFGFGLGF